MIEVVIAFVRQYWKPIAYITFLALIFGFGYYKGYQHEKIKYDAHLEEDARLIAIAKAENERKVREQEDITNQVTEGYAHAITSLKQYYAAHPNIKWMSTPCTSGGLPQVSGTASGTNEGTQGNTVSTEGLTPEQWAEDVMTILKWQEWARKQQGVK